MPRHTETAAGEAGPLSVLESAGLAVVEKGRTRRGGMDLGDGEAVLLSVLESTRSVVTGKGSGRGGGMAGEARPLSVLESPNLSETCGNRESRELAEPMVLVVTRGRLREGGTTSALEAVVLAVFLAIPLVVPAVIAVVMLETLAGRASASGLASSCPIMCETTPMSPFSSWITSQKRSSVLSCVLMDSSRALLESLSSPTTS